MRFALLSGLLALALHGVAGENLCLNGGLEKGTEGWVFPDPSYRVEQGAGIGGSAAIVFDAGEWRKHDGPRYEIAAKPGRVYRFSGRIKRDTVTNVVQIALVRMTKSHGWITQVVAERSDVNAVDSDGWDYYEGETAFLDRESEILRLYLYIRNGACGRFRADDFRIEELPEDPLGDLQTSAYRNAAVSGPVTFVVPVRVNPFERRLEELRAELAYVDPKGAKRVAAMRIEGALAKATLDAETVSPGGQTVVATLFDAAGGRLDTASATFTRLEAEPDYPVRVDGNRRFFVRGKPFFPICITWGMSIKRKEWPAAMEKFRNGPFNVAMVYEHDITPKDLDFFLANGMMVKCNLKDVYTGFPQVHPPQGVKTEADELRYVTEKVNLLKDHPGLFAWYINDEFPPTMAGRVKRRCEFLHRLDPTHPVSVCLCRPYTIGAFNGGFDIISSDPYPVGRDDPLSLAAKWTRITDDQVYGTKPMMQTAQAFDWAWFPGQFKNPHFPTYEELRSMTWQMIAEGATGVGFFSYSCIYANLKGKAFDRALGDTVRVASEVKAMAPAILSSEKAPRIVAAPKDLSVRAWRHEGKVHLVACDLTGGVSTPRLRLEGCYSAATCAEGAEAALAADGTLELKLPSYGVAIVQLTPADASLAGCAGEVAVSVDGKPLKVEQARCSAMPVNIRWPGHQRDLDQTELCSFVRFDLSRPVTLRVSPGRKFEKVVVRPLAKHVVPARDGDAVVFQVKEAGAYSVEFDGRRRNLHVFADPPADYSAINKAAANVKYFGPGEHDVGLITLKSGETLFIDEGAVVYGRVHAVDADHVRILGRGILDGSRVKELPVAVDPAVLEERRRKGWALGNVKRVHEIMFDYCKDVKVEGIVIRDSPLYTIRPVCCDGFTAENVKIIGNWRYNSDGIDMHNCRKVLLRNCFLRTFDDSICVKGFDYVLKEEDMLHNGVLHDVFEDVLVEKCTVWCDWGHALEIGAETRAKEIRNVTFRDCDVIWHCASPLNVKHCDQAYVHHIAYENIRVEYDDDMPYSMLAERASAFDASKKGKLAALVSAGIQYIPEYSKPDSRGRMSDISFRDIDVYSSRLPGGSFSGFDQDHRIEGVEIDHIRLNGKDVTGQFRQAASFNKFASPRW